MICNTNESKAVMTFPMENPSNNKVLSECTNMQSNLHLGPEDCIDSTKKADCCPASCSSNALMVNMSTMFSNAASPLVDDHPNTLGDTDYLTPNKNGFSSGSAYGISKSYATPPVDFSVLTAADFGITPDSFTKQYKGNSKNLLKKFRRRSTIGVRGSPENNSLIRYIAQQRRIKKQDTLASPLKCRNTWLKDKMAAFQSSFKPFEETKESVVHIPGSSMKTDASLHEQSKVGLSECKSVAFEENQHWKSVSRGRTSANTQGGNIVSPLQKRSISSTTAISKDIPVLQADTRESGCIHLEATTDKSKAVCGMPSEPTDAELSSNATSNQSCKKVRFAEKQSLEIFDENKPPVTPVLRGQLSSDSLRSALKKTPVTMFTKDIKGHLYKRTKEGSEVLPDCKMFEPLQIERSTGPKAEMKVCSKDLEPDVFDTLLSVDTPLRGRREAMFSASGSREKSYPNISPDKQPLSQPNFDYVDELLQQSPDVVSTPEYAVNSDLEETKSSSPACQATSTRTTRSSAKRKSTNKAEEMALTLTNKKPKKSTKFQKAEAATKSSEKTTAARRKVFGKKRKKKQKALYGQRQTVSKKPLLSPILEMAEDCSFMSSYQSTPKSEVSVFDDSSSNVLNAESTCENKPNIQHSGRKDSSCLHSSLNLVKEDALPDNVSGSSLQLQDAATNDVKDTLPWNPLEKSSLQKSKSTIDEKEQVLKSDCCSSETEMTEEPELLNFHGADKNKSKGDLILIEGSVTEPMRDSGVNLDFKRFPRRSRRLSCFSPSVEDFESKAPGNDPNAPRDNINELPPWTINDFELLNNLQCSLEESFKGVTSSNRKRVRRSMRLLKDAESDGLAWIQTPHDNVLGQAILGSADKVQKRKFTSRCQEAEPRYPKQGTGDQILLPMKEEQEKTHVAVGPSESRRKSISVLSLEENKNVALCNWRNRRNSLGYKSDRYYQKDPVNQKII